MPYFQYNDGGTVVQYYVSKILEEDYGLNVRIYSWSNIKLKNSIFNKFYENDFPIDDNCIVVYCEGTKGNPLNAKYCIRWMLSKLGGIWAPKPKSGPHKKFDSFPLILILRNVPLLIKISLP
jgi:hypothetical protein